MTACAVTNRFLVCNNVGRLLQKISHTQIAFWFNYVMFKSRQSVKRFSAEIYWMLCTWSWITFKICQIPMDKNKHLYHRSVLREHRAIRETVALDLFDLWSRTREVFAVEKHLDHLENSLNLLSVWSHRNSLRVWLSITWSDRARIQSFMQDFWFPLANTSRYVRSAILSVIKM